jgi:hypothetical protein
MMYAYKVARMNTLEFVLVECTPRNSISSSYGSRLGGKNLGEAMLHSLYPFK